MKTKIVLIILLISSLSWAYQIQDRLENADSLLIGKPFQLQVDIFSAQQDSIYIPPIDTLDIFVLAQEPTINEKIVKDSLKTSLSLTFQPFDVGEYTLPSIEFFVKSAADLHSLSTQSYQLQVYSTVADSVVTISEIADPTAVYLGLWDYLLIIFSLAALAAIIYYLIKFLKKPSHSEPIAVPQDNRPPYIIALQELEALKSKNYLRQGDFLSYYFRLSFILRLFIELHYQIRALEMTTSEVRDNLTACDHREKSQILDFLRKCDMIKFAKFTPGLQQAEQAIAWLENYLQSFKPEEEPNA
jgi:hypothetical protein